MKNPRSRVHNSIHFYNIFFLYKSLFLFFYYTINIKITIINTGKSWPLGNSSVPTLQIDDYSYINEIKSTSG